MVGNNEIRQFIYDNILEFFKILAEANPEIKNTTCELIQAILINEDVNGYIYNDLTNIVLREYKLFTGKIIPSKIIIIFTRKSSPTNARNS